ncbi:ABC transporter permease [Aquincola sp. S2]|uniref:ABC transporter permease n=1 Tax=Pseudaquabacterium terrae TaxID=2732868 RepID=A0ABX2EJM6_9BURK|nr:ABC transporter permease [Aquabacterium terrae]NRF68785.1 ABC transporter permease [Aquabacterium terrae]
MRSNALIGGVIVGAVVMMASLAALWTPHDPLAVNLGVKLAAPSAAHWWGTDEFGRDVLSRAMTGAATSCLIALCTVLLAVVLGAAIGVLAGFVRGWLDRVLMAVNDALLAFPGILLAMGMIVVLGASRWGVVAALGLAYAPSVARIVRGTVLSLREREFVEASRMIGNPEWLTMLRHVLPNCVAPVAVLATSMFGWVLLAESALSFLGLGVAPPAPTWGNMLAGARPYLQSAMWLGIAPGLCIALTLLGINLLGDAVRDRLDPRMVR